METETLQLTFILVTVAFSVLAVEAKNLLRAVAGLFGATTSLGILFILLNAYQVGVLQILVYSGGVVALFVVVIMLTKKGREEA